MNDMFKVLTLENYDRFTTDFLVMFHNILKAKERKEAEEKHLAELKERVESAEKEFKKAIENYEHNTTH